MFAAVALAHPLRGSLHATRTQACLHPAPDHRAPRGPDRRAGGQPDGRDQPDLRRGRQHRLAACRRLRRAVQPRLDRGRHHRLVRAVHGGGRDGHLEGHGARREDAAAGRVLPRARGEGRAAAGAGCYRHHRPLEHGRQRGARRQRDGPRDGVSHGGRGRGHRRLRDRRRMLADEADGGAQQHDERPPRRRGLHRNGRQLRRLRDRRPGPS